MTNLETPERTGRYACGVILKQKYFCHSAFSFCYFWLSVEMSFNLAVIKDHLYVKKWNGGLQYCLFEFNLWVKTVACIKDQKSIVNVQCTYKKHT